MRATLCLLPLLLACSSPPAPVPATPTPEPVAPVVEPAPAQRALLSHELVLTAGASPDDALPLLIAVHGMGSRPERFARSVEGLAIPARIILPLAPHPTANGGGSWFGFQVGDPDREGLGLRIHEAAEDVVALMDWAEDRYPTAGEPVITGFSQGGMISFAVAAGWPEHIQAAVPVGGDLPLTLIEDRPSTPENLPDIQAFHGEDDEVVPIGPVREAVTALQARDYPAELHSYAGIAHRIGPQMRTDWHAALASALLLEPVPVEGALCPPVDGRAEARAVEQRVILEGNTVVVEACPHEAGFTAVRARVDGGSWTWQGDYDFERPAWENDSIYYHFQRAGILDDGRAVLALSYHTCDHDGCDKVRFYGVAPDGSVSVLADDTQAHAWGNVAHGAFQYVDRTGYSMGYHVASAGWTYRWDGEQLMRQPNPDLVAEYPTWPCPDSTVQPVDKNSREPVGEPIAVPQGAPIEVLSTSPREPGTLFEYQVEGQRFWALNWTQTCAG